MSHDRAFIDHVVTSTLVFEGDGRVQEYVGGYEDWLRQRRHAEPERARKAVAAATLMQRRPTPRRLAAQARKPSYKEQLELDQLPSRIEALEAEQQQLQSDVTSADFYKRPALKFMKCSRRLEELETLLLTAYTRWDALDSRTSP